MTINNKPKFLGYTRVSISENSLEDQKLAIYQYCKSQEINTKNNKIFNIIKIPISERKGIDNKIV
jgi:hypothetical protein